MSFEATGGMVRLRSCVATLRQSARSDSMSLAVAAFRKLAGLRDFGLWHAPQFSTSTGRIVCVNSCAGSAANAAAGCEQQ